MTQTYTKRLHSLDVLRGFDMFWIMGAEDIIHQSAETFPNSITKSLAGFFIHSNWNGFTVYDLIFPLFLFIAGVAAPFSIGNDVKEGINRSELVWRALKRGGILVILGIIYNLHGFRFLPFAETRFASVLGHIGIAWALATIIFIYVSNLKNIIYFIVGLLAFYWVIFYIGHVPDFNAGDLTKEGNFVSYFDRQFLPGKLHGIIHDPEGLLSKIAATATALIGIGTGILLKTLSMDSLKKVKILVLVGFGLILFSLLWNLVLPINKNLWSSSFVCFTGGLSMLLMAVFYYLIDVKGYKGIFTSFFSVIGVNSIFIYLSDKFINWQFTSNAIFGGITTLFEKHLTSLIIIIGVLAIKWAFLWFLNKKKIYLKV